MKSLNLHKFPILYQNLSFFLVVENKNKLYTINMPRPRAARGRGRGAQRSFVLARNYPQGLPPPPPPPPQRRVQTAATPQIAFWPWDVESFNIDDTLMNLRVGQQYNEFELGEFLQERLADYELALRDQPAEHRLYHMLPELRTLYQFYPDIDWLNVS